MNRIRVIEKSRGCLYGGLAGIPPFIGMAFAVMAIWRWHQARVAAAGDWNPARAHLCRGLALACLGLIWSVAIRLSSVTSRDRQCPRLWLKDRFL